MLKGNAYRIAIQTRQYLKRNNLTRALWITNNNGDVARTPPTDWDIRQMKAKGASLIGVFTANIPNAELADAIITVAAEHRQEPTP